MCFDLSRPNYGTQIEEFLSQGSPISPGDLFMFWGAHNDIVGGIDVQTIADNMTQHVTTLLDHGATDIVFLDLFDGARQSAKLNGLLSQSLEMLRQQHPDATIIEVDIPKMTNEFFNNPGKWGISNVDTPALNTRTLIVRDNPDEYLDWDGTHLTSAFNKVIADYVLRSMDAELIRQGDFDGDDALATEDIDALAAAARAPEIDLQYDLDFDGVVDWADQRIWVKDFRHTYFGDANLDGEFNSGDLIDALGAGTYEADIEAGWASGDFNGSGRFESTDLVDALADGGYEAGPRPPAAAAVPEPSGAALLALGLLGLSVCRQQLS
jgi:hypothetical protein